jgi:hypothetical protein
MGTLKGFAPPFGPPPAASSPLASLGLAKPSRALAPSGEALLRQRERAPAVPEFFVHTMRHEVIRPWAGRATARDPVIGFPARRVAPARARPRRARDLCPSGGCILPVRRARPPMSVASEWRRLIAVRPRGARSGGAGRRLLDGPHSDSEGRPMDSGCRQPTEHTRRIRLRTGELLP